MWGWLRASVTVDALGVNLRGDLIPFAEIADASLDGSVLILTTLDGKSRRARVWRHRLALLESILDGLAATRDRGRTIYRSAPASLVLEPRRPRRIRRRGAKAGSSDLWIGRTLYH